VALRADVLIVADEFPAMEYLAAKLKTEADLTARLVAQSALPASLSPFSAVVVYIHGALAEATERALIDYTEAGGRLVALHHSISSGKRKNAHWLKFLGIELPPGDVRQGGYQWIEPVTLDLVNLAPDHYITQHGVPYPARLSYRSPEPPGAEAVRPSFTLTDSEVYLNHRFTGPRTVLLGFRYQDAKSGVIYMQDRAGWLKPAGKGWIIYLLPGHSQRDFENPCYLRIVVNAVAYDPAAHFLR
jgi:hypothetical protein